MTKRMIYPVIDKVRLLLFTNINSANDLIPPPNYPYDTTEYIISRASAYSEVIEMGDMVDVTYIKPNTPNGEIIQDTIIGRIDIFQQDSETISVMVIDDITGSMINIHSDGGNVIQSLRKIKKNMEE